MNEMDVLTAMRAEVPASPPPEGVAQALLLAIEAEKAGTPGTAIRASREPKARKLAIAGGLSAVLAAGAAAGIIAATAGGPAAGRAPGLSPAAAAAAHARLAVHAELVAVLNRAAAAAAARPAFPPGQWIYWKEEYDARGTSPATDAGWETADGKLMADTRHGKVHVFSIVARTRQYNISEGLVPLNAITYSSFGSLPKDPAALVNFFEQQYPGLPAAQQQEKAVASIRELLTVYTPPPAFTAELFHAISDIPGVTVNTHGVDTAGRPAIVLGYKNSVQGLTDQFYLDPRSYAYLGVADVVSNESGTGLAGYSILRYVFVSGPGVRP